MLHQGQNYAEVSRFDDGDSGRLILKRNSLRFVRAVIFSASTVRGSRPAEPKCSNILANRLRILLVKQYPQDFLSSARAFHPVVFGVGLSNPGSEIHGIRKTE